jgi:hypothetical protein
MSRCGHGGADERGKLVAIQRAAAVHAYAHIYPPERYLFPDVGVAAEWKTALADPNFEDYVAECVASRSETSPSPATSCAASTCSLSIKVAALARGCTTARKRVRGVARARLWTLEANAIGRRFYERRG